MDIEAIRLAKAELEKEIRMLLVEFHQQTSVMPMRLSIDHIDCTTFSDFKVRHAVGNVNVTLEII